MVFHEQLQKSPGKAFFLQHNWVSHYSTRSNKWCFSENEVNLIQNRHKPKMFIVVGMLIETMIHNIVSNEK